MQLDVIEISPWKKSETQPAVSDQTSEEPEEIISEDVSHTESCPNGCYKVVTRFFLKSA